MPVLFITFHYLILSKITVLIQNKKKEIKIFFFLNFLNFFHCVNLFKKQQVNTKKNNKKIRNVQEKRDLLTALKSKLINSPAERINEEVYTNMEV